MKKHILFIVSITICTVFGLGFVANNNDPIASILAKLEQYSQENPQEKVHLHMDKPFYSVGDDIWFKAYIVNAEDNRLSNLSKIFYVELLTPNDSITQSLRLPVIAGLCAGNFTLTDPLPEGNYRIRAYTNLMRNNEGFIFDKTIRVGNSPTSEVITNVSYSFSKDGEKDIVHADLIYAKLNGEPLAGQDVSYDIQINNKIVNKGKGVTDGEGHLRISFTNSNPQLINWGQINTSFVYESTKISKAFPIKAASNNVDVQFFPESGQQIVNTRSKMGFKAVGADGLGVKVTGYVIDKNNNQIIDFESENAGMGSFTFGPEAGNTYTAVVKFTDGTEKKFDLPKAFESGYSLTVTNSNPDTLLVKVNASANFSTNKVALIAQSNSRVKFVADIVLKGGPTVVKIPKNKLPLGILQLTLFASNQPVAERLSFIRKSEKLNVAVSTDKKSYGKREKVKMDLKVTDQTGNPVQTLLSLAVTDQSKVSIDEINETTIYSNLLLSSDIKGYIEKPNYYFVNVNDKKNRDLDNLLITQGWSRFNWQTILNGTNKPLIYQPELSLSISGQVVTLGGSPVPGAKVTLLTSAGKGLLLDTIADNNGRFNFDRLVFEENTKFVVQAKNPKDKKYNVEVLLDPIPKATIARNKNNADVEINVDNSLLTYLQNSRKQYEEMVRLGLVERAIDLSQVTVVEKRTDFAADDYFAAGTESQAIGGDKFQNCADILQCIQTLVPGVTVANNKLYLPRNISSEIAMGIIIDGIPVESDYLMNLTPQDVASMRVYRDMAGIGIMGRSGGGNISITTRRGTGAYTARYTPNVKTSISSGLSKIKQFYAPKYDDPKIDSKVADLRSTIYWNPQILTNKEGFASVEFFNADGTGVYRTVIEGLTTTGRLAHQTFNFNVK